MPELVLKIHPAGASAKPRRTFAQSPPAFRAETRADPPRLLVNRGFAAPSSPTRERSRPSRRHPCASRNHRKQASDRRVRLPRATFCSAALRFIGLEITSDLPQPDVHRCIPASASKSGAAPLQKNLAAKGIQSRSGNVLLPDLIRSPICPVSKCSTISYKTKPRSMLPEP